MQAPKSHRELKVYQSAMAALIEIILLSKTFPDCEKWDLTKQIRSSSRSVCSCLAEAWRKRNYPAAFASKLTDAESEAAKAVLDRSGLFTWIRL
jgi:four helix bundle protein